MLRDFRPSARLSIPTVLPLLLLVCLLGSFITYSSVLLSTRIVAEVGVESVEMALKPLNDRQRELIGVWKHESVENADAFLKKIGISYFLRQIAKLQKPVVKIVYEDDVWKIFIESAFKRNRLTTIDGRQFYSTTTLEEDGTQTDVQECTEDEPNNIPSVTKRFVEDAKLVITEEREGVVSRRVFTRVEE